MPGMNGNSIWTPGQNWQMRITGDCQQCRKYMQWLFYPAGQRHVIEAHGTIYHFDMTALAHLTTLKFMADPGCTRIIGLEDMAALLGYFPYSRQHMAHVDLLKPGVLAQIKIGDKLVPTVVDGIHRMAVYHKEVKKFPVIKISPEETEQCIVRMEPLIKID